MPRRHRSAHQTTGASSTRHLSLPCLICNRTFKSRSTWTKHRRIAHPDAQAGPSINRTQMPLEFHPPGFNRRALFTPRVIHTSKSIHSPPIFDSDEYGDAWMLADDNEMNLDEPELENSPPASPSTTTSASDESNPTVTTEYHPIINGLFLYFIASRKFNLISFT